MSRWPTTPAPIGGALVSAAVGAEQLRVKPEPWMVEAACRESVDPDIFYPESHTRAEKREAVACCRRCPVRPQCLTYAITAGEHAGIWGGLTPMERRDHRRQVAV